MTGAFSRFGNDLHTGRREYPIVRRRRAWYALSALVLVVLGTLAIVRGPNLGIEFTGGSEFQVAGAGSADQALARDVVREHVPGNEPKISVVGGSGLRIHTEQLSSEETSSLAQDLAEAYEVPASQVSSSFVGPTWGGDVTASALRAVAVFLVLVGAVMALYFRDVKASIAALLALVHDMLLTAAVYVAVGFEVTPATVIGFLTILGYSLYDTVVVFDKVRENTEELAARGWTYEQAVERAANQTLVRSINTSVVALLPVAAILGIGAFLLGAGTLKDISLALFVGILAGTYSSIFLAPGFLTDLQRGERGPRAAASRAARRETAAHRAVDVRTGLDDDRDDRDVPGDRDGLEDREDREDDAARVGRRESDGAAEPAPASTAHGPSTVRVQPRRVSRRRRSR